MRRLKFLVLALALGITATTTARAQQVPPIMIAKDLLLPCQEADNDPRDGFIAQLECIRFIRGFLSGLDAGSDGAAQLCLPELNVDDTLRRTYVAWVHASFSKRSKLTVGDALHAALSDSFACQ